ncbi:histidine phosphatase superfamily [Geopyxis carbonaria]|nr:histidine phosphatase superfamily [Geopyxis carbonaria]
MHSSQWSIALASALSATAQWLPPSQTPTNNATFALHGPGLNGFIYNSSSTAAVYNYCNMPHASTPSRPPRSHTLVYAEAIHRHHKRTPYASNLFPIETPPWDCTSTHLHFFATTPGVPSAQTFWRTYHDPLNPLSTPFAGTCQFPQLTPGGLADSAAHGRNLWTAYSRALLPLSATSPAIAFRATANVITSQVAGALIRGMYPLHPAASPVPLLQQPPAVDSLAPSYACPAADALRAEITRHEAWTAHLAAAAPLLARLDAITGVDPGSAGWHANVDHYFDALTSRLCHGLPLPCSPSDPARCVTEEDAAQVFRWGQWEYSFLYRDHPSSLRYASLKMGIWLNELLGHLEAPGEVRWRHNVAHDGSVSLLLAALQVREMVWPGMGAEVVVEKWRAEGGDEFVRVLWGGRRMEMAWTEKEMVPMKEFVAYVRGLIGEGAREVVEACGYA